jgi:ribonuclease HII
VVDNYIIDDINIRQANREAMRRAIVELKRKLTPQNKTPLNPPLSGGRQDLQLEVLIDGRDNYVFDELDKKPIYIVGGDGKIIEIGAASIIAKVFRDKLMTAYASLYAQFGFETYAGYGTKKHREALQNPEDITGIHRTSYKPIQAVAEKKPKLLLHVCCGPDATVPIMDLKKDYDVTCFWYDPNIQPKKEHDKRLAEMVKICEIE